MGYPLASRLCRYCERCERGVISTQPILPYSNEINHYLVVLQSQSHSHATAPLLSILLVAGSRVFSQNPILRVTEQLNMYRIPRVVFRVGELLFSAYQPLGKATKSTLRQFNHLGPEGIMMITQTPVAFCRIHK